MQLLDRRTFMALSAAAAASGLTGPARAAQPQADIFTADLWGAAVDSTVILGEESAVLIDAQLTVPNAMRLADIIAATGRTLETICITHVHPDHHLGLAIIMDRFPDARPVAHPKVQSQLSAAASSACMLASVSGVTVTSLASRA